MSQKFRVKWLSMTRAGLFLGACVLAFGCGGDPEGRVLRADAEFDPDTTANVFQPLNESNRAVAQTFVVEEASGLFEEFWIVLTDGESDDEGLVRITVRPLNGMGVPDPDESSSIIRPINVNTATLPAFGANEFTEFFVGDDPGREIVMGDEFGIVVEFISRTTNTDTDAVARLIGVSGNRFAEGTGSEDPDGTGFVNTTDDYFFRTFVLGDI